MNKERVIEKDSKILSENIVKIENVSFKYKGSNEGLLDNVSLSIKRGETVLLTGESGSGKTTIIRLINGLIPHYYQGDISGKVTVDKFDIEKTELWELAGTVGTVFQNPRSQFFSIDTDGEIVFGPENIGLKRDEILKRKNQVVKSMNIEKLLGRSLFELSGGQKQSIACASVSALLPDIVLLDEPSSNLDHNAINKLREVIKKWKSEGKTIIISEHRLWYIKDLCDRVLYMESGKIKSEWDGKTFADMDEESIRKLKLRPLVVSGMCYKVKEDDRFKHEQINESMDHIILKDFYFSYNHRGKLFKKNRYKNCDEKTLSLCIPELKIPRGKVIGIVGENGTGKSTFLRSVCGLLKNCDGVIKCDDKTYKGKDRLKFSYMVMQDVNHQLFTDSVKSEVLLSMENEDEKVCEDILNDLGIKEYMDKHPMALSGGQKQRVAIASAIGAKAELMLFDEPTSGLDFSHMIKVGKLLKELTGSGKTVLVATHDYELIEECCDYVLCIENGKVKYISKR